ncbi:MAG: molybdenum cofactor guanylyltransferase [Desulfobacterales bacterium]|nr:molybdenum cofactor guanylyltransferase [Desulfobacterales bacterium]
MGADLESIPGVTGVILAGGRSSRFGRNKALAELSGRPLIEQVAATLCPLFPSCLVVTDTPGQYRFLDLPMINDVFPDKGPLAGIHAALEASGEERVFIAACDMPFLAPELVRYLCKLSRESDSLAVVPRLSRGPEPLCAVYHRDAAGLFAHRLGRDLGSVADALARIQVRWVAEAELLSVVPDLKSFVNLNYPGELDAVQGPGPDKKTR